MSKIIYRLKEARKLNGLTLREASKKLREERDFHISHEGLRKYEKGEVKMDSTKLIMFANFYKVPVDYLMPNPNRPKVKLGKIHFHKIKKGY